MSPVVQKSLLIIVTALAADGSSYQNPRQMVAFEPDATVTFRISRASVFFLWGAVNYDHLTSRATITGEDGQSTETRLDGRSEFVAFQQILYWHSGLDPDKNYTVQIVNGQSEASVMPAFSFNKLELIDGCVYPRTCLNQQTMIFFFSQGTNPGVQTQ